MRYAPPQTNEYLNVLNVRAFVQMEKHVIIMVFTKAIERKRDRGREGDTG